MDIIEQQYYGFVTYTRVLGKIDENVFVLLVKKNKENHQRSYQTNKLELARNAMYIIAKNDQKINKIVFKMTKTIYIYIVE